MAREKTGSEGEAYRYVKKFLLHHDQENPGFIDSFGAHVRDYSEKYMVSALRAFFMELRHTFFRNGVGDIYFAPGVARLAVELEFHKDSPNYRSLDNLVYIVNMISTAHRGDYDRNLNGISYKELNETYGVVVQQNWKEIKELLKTMEYGPRRYTIIKLDSFETAQKYKEYTEPHTWCHFAYKDMFESYSHRGYIDLYLAVLPGFETMTQDDPLYGESMLGIDIGYEGRLIHVNNRWNHAKDNVDGRKGDNKYNEIELSELLGGPFYEICPSSLSVDEVALTKEIYNRIHSRNEVYFNLAEKMKSAINCMRNVRVEVAPYRKRDEWFYDKRDGGHYRTVDVGGTTWMLEPLHYIPDGALYGECGMEVQLVCVPDAYPPADIIAGMMGLRGMNHVANVVTTSGLGYLSVNNELTDVCTNAYQYGFKNGLFPVCPNIIKRQLMGGLHEDDCVVLYRGNLEQYIPDGWRVPTVEEYAQLFTICASGTLKIDDMTDRILAEEPNEVKRQFEEVVGISGTGGYIFHCDTSHDWNLRFDELSAKRTWGQIGGNPVLFSDDGMVHVSIYETDNVCYNLCDGFFYSSTDLDSACDHVRVGPYGIRLEMEETSHGIIVSSSVSKYAPLFLVKKKSTDKDMKIKTSWRC